MNKSAGTDCSMNLICSVDRFILRILCLVVLTSFARAVLYTSTQTVSDPVVEKNCSARCERLFDRSLKRVGFVMETVGGAIRTANAQDGSVICWKFLDYDDCERQCRPSSRSPFGRQRASLDRKCKKVTASSPYLKHFQCLHRFHTFLEVRCSSYAKEATRFRVFSKLAKDDEFLLSRLPAGAQNVSREMLIHETCRFLHYHGMCLANAVFSHCPQADDLFNRFTLRDYFLSFVVPKRDLLFTDRLLDYCQLYDFQKIARDLFDSTKSTAKRHLGEDEITLAGSGILVTRPHHPPPFATDRSSDLNNKKKSIFSSDEDLLDTPPNFYYSSAKYTKSYREALERLNYQTTDHDQAIDGLALITHPIDRTDEQAAQSDRTTISMEKMTWPDLHPTPASDHQFLSEKQDDGRYDVDFDSETADVEGDYEDYVEQNGPLFRDQPHVFKIRKYDEPGDELEYQRRGLVFGHRQGVRPPISVTVHHVNENGEPTDEFDTSKDETEDSTFDPNEITFPGRKNREKTTRQSRVKRPPPSVADVLRTFVTTALHPTTPHPIHDQQSTQTVMFLMIAYSFFFVTALLILISLLVAFVIRRRRATYATYLVKKTSKF